MKKKIKVRKNKKNVLEQFKSVNLSEEIEANLTNKLGTETFTVIGILKIKNEMGVILPINRKNKNISFLLLEKGNAKDGDFVEAEIIKSKKNYIKNQCKIIRIFGTNQVKNLPSLMAIYEHKIPYIFSNEVLVEANKVSKRKLGKNLEDLTKIPFITIDPEDARDHDDAVYATSDSSSNNKNVIVLWVAIADVTFYLDSNDVLDEEAYKRGNSTYFEDIAIPMIPEILSSEVCSLKKGKIRPALIAKIVISDTGQKIHHEFIRGKVKIFESLSYEKAQTIHENTNTRNKKLKVILDDLWKLSSILDSSKKKEAPLALNLVERKINLSEDGDVNSIDVVKKLCSHKVIENCMILANLCAAQTLKKNNEKFLYRVHEAPTREKIKVLQNISKSVGLRLQVNSNIKATDLNQLQESANKTVYSQLISLNILKTMSQAHYNNENTGHFGLNLKEYTHFTSPIRRYADIIVHRALISTHGWVTVSPNTSAKLELKKIGEHISGTERRSVIAERDSRDRYLAMHLEKNIGNHFHAKIINATKFGLFVKLTETGADGLIPVRSIESDYFRFNKILNQFIGRDSKVRLAIGTEVLVELKEVNSLTGSLIFHLLEANGKAIQFNKNSIKEKWKRRKNSKSKNRNR